MSNTLSGTVPGRGIIKGSLQVVYGKSAYEIAVANGFEGTEEEWLESISEDAAEVLAETAEYIFYGGDASGIPSAILSTEQIAEGLEQLEQITEDVEQIDTRLEETASDVENIKNGYGNRIKANEDNIDKIKTDIKELGEIDAFTLVRVNGCEIEIDGVKTDVSILRTNCESRLFEAEAAISILETDIGLLQPPTMEVDIECEANEKCGNKTVYIKRKQLSTLANTGGNVSVSIGASVETLVDITIIIRSATSPNGTYSRYKLPAFNVETGNLMATFRLNSSQTINIYSFADLTSYSAEIFVKYTKE